MATQLFRRSALALGACLLAIAPAFGQSASLQQSGLVGRFEAAQVVSDPAAWPKNFNESPALQQLVRTGRLPALANRLPKEPLVLRPIHEVGRYGGTMRRGFTGPADDENGNRINASDKLITWDAEGTGLVPSVAKSWSMSADGKAFNISLREGMRWSDGAPFTADDFVFWFEEIHNNTAIVASPIVDLSPQGKPGRIVKRSATEIAFEFDVPFHLFEELIAGDTTIGGGQAVTQSASRIGGGYAPAHYLKQFLPKFSSEDEVNRRARADGFENWVQAFHAKKDWTLNPDLPVLGPWVTTRPRNTPIWVLERNPYYWAVDTAGNQLPYIDRIVMTLAEDTEVINLRTISGEYDWQERHIDLGKLPVLLQNQAKSGYKVYLDPAVNGSDTVLQINTSFSADPEIGKWLRNADFRRALSLGIDRNQLNETFWLGVGVPGSVAPADSMPESPGKEWRQRWSTFDARQANEMLDKIGLTRKDAQGFRLRTDNGQRLRLQIQAVKAFLPWPQQAEMIAQQWRRIGIQADVRDMERNLALTRTRNNEHHIQVWTNGGTELLYLFPRHAIPVEPVSAFMGPEYARWFASGGQRGAKPEDPEMLRIFDLFQQAASLKKHERDAIAQEIWKIIVEQQYGIGTVGQSPAFMGVRVVKTNLGNVPSRLCAAQHCRPPGSGRLETVFFRSP